MPVRLREGRSIAEVLPEAGGAIATFYWEEAGGRLDWLRGPADIARATAEACGCFPLVPFSNRVRDGRFSFEGRRVQLPIDAETGPHFEHGHGWRSPWRVLDRDAAQVRIRFDHDADAWPWSYRAEQHIRLSDDELSCRLSVTNFSTDPMPTGLGLHPYFPVTPLARLTAAVSKCWVTDCEVLPVRLTAPGPATDPNHGIHLETADLDTVFTQWRHSARIEWPERGASLEMRAEAPLDFLIIYVPPSMGYCCVEPVSNMTDAFNFASRGQPGTGLIALAAGATVSAKIRFIPSFHNQTPKGSDQ